MDCPVCKYPNPSGATHCGMCYEVFNRSAAQAYLHAVKRERLQKEKPEEKEPEAVIQSQRVVEETKSFISKIDWNRISQEILVFAQKHWKKFTVFIGIWMTWILLSFLFSNALWYHLIGKKLVYAFPDKPPVDYLVGLKQNIKIWSERQGRLDTPIETQRLDEMGNVIVEKKAQLVTVKNREWLQIMSDESGSASHMIAKNHSSLASVHVLLDKRGHVLERRAALSPRVAKSLPFLVPRFPKKRLHAGATWDENVEWLDSYEDWKIYWWGTFHWTLGGLIPCGDNTCVQLTYTTTNLTPHLRGVPSWAANVVHSLQGRVSTEGHAIFDPSHKRLISNSFFYDGILQFPIQKLERIPIELRIGRVTHGPGDIVLRFENKIDVRKN